jgi:hypothetical protein
MYVVGNCIRINKNVAWTAVFLVSPPQKKTTKPKTRARILNSFKVKVTSFQASQTLSLWTLFSCRFNQRDDKRRSISEWRRKKNFLDCSFKMGWSPGRDSRVLAYKWVIVIINAKSWEYYFILKLVSIRLKSFAKSASETLSQFRPWS